MGYKQILWILLILSLVGIAIGYGIVFPDKVGLCAEGDSECIFSFPVFSVGEPLLFGLWPLGVTSLILLFLSERIFASWKKFAIVLIPLAILWVVFTPVTPHTGTYLSIAFDKQQAALTSGIIYLLGSLGIIIYKSLSAPKKPRMDDVRGRY